MSSDTRRPAPSPARAAGAVALAAAALLTLGPAPADAQYFGQNKVQYEDFDFQVLETEHFDVYFYEREREAVVKASRMAERWYARLSRLLDHELTGRQPLILYASHPDFRQTNVIAGRIAEGTGGVTEPLKRRIVMPMAGPLAETDHVLGHELVHGFQYDFSGIRPGAPLAGAPMIAGLPTWMVEGMAEYLSVGPKSALTAMWLRDALESESELPTISDLSNPREYFPYRWGHAVWTFVGGHWGEQAVREAFVRSLQGSPRRALASVTGLPVDTLSKRWQQSIRDVYGPVLEATGDPSDVAEAIVTEESADAGTNVSPAISPDGERMVFLSEKSRFAMEMYLADAQTGEILRKLTETAVDPHYQSLQFINSAGAWAPGGDRFAFAAVKEGDPIVTILDPSTGERLREMRFRELGEVFNPTWSPDGTRMAFVANDGGVMDLFVVDLETGDLRRLTDDAFAELHPDWSPDGSRIAFSTDRFTSDLDTLSHGPYRLAAISVETGQIEGLPSISGARNSNPQWSPDGESLYFISDRGGIPNLYRVDTGTRDVSQLTDVGTGVSGITELSPALTVAEQSGRVVFGVYQDGNHALYRMDRPRALSADEIRLPGAADLPAQLPPPGGNETLAGLLSNWELGLPSAVTFRMHDYDADLSLDYISQPSLGFGASSAGVFIGGGAQLFFSDMLGQHGLSTQLQLAVQNGQVLNGIGLVGQYVNQEERAGWGVVVGQMPEFNRSLQRGSADVDGDGTAEILQRELNFWKINRRAMGLFRYPFSTTRRIEFSAGFERIDFELRTRTQVFTRRGQEIEDTSTDAPACADSLTFGRSFCEPGALNEAVGSAALVYDNSLSGPTGPIMGHRHRLEVSPSFGTLNYVTGIGDVRHYWMPFRPVTFAGRLFHLGRYGSGAEDQRLARLYLGQPSLMRGYGSGSFDLSACPTNLPLSQCDEVRVFQELFGSRLLVSNVEMRIPLFGPLGVLGRGGVPPLDLIGFFDAGVAWTSGVEPSFAGGVREPVKSAGVGVRVNLFGFAMGELDWVVPLDRPDKDPYITFNLSPGF